jgi:hypothetical protein
LLANSNITDAYKKSIPEVEDALKKGFEDYRKA